MNETSLRDFYFVVFRHNRKALLFFSTLIVTVLIGTFLVSETYKSDAKLMVRLGKESVSLDPTATTGQVANVESAFGNEINSEISILESRDLAEKVVDIFGLDIFLSGSPPTDSDPPLAKLRTFIKNSIVWPLTTMSRLMNTQGNLVEDARKRDAAILVFMKALRVEANKDSNIISIMFTADNPNIARNVLTTLIERYLDKHINAYQTRGSFEFFTRQQGRLKDTLARTEEELKLMKNQLGVLPSRDILMEQTAFIVSELEKTKSDLAASKANIIFFKRKLAGIPATLVASESTGMPNSARDVLVQRLNDLQLKEHELLSIFLEQSIPVAEIHKQIAEAKSMLAKTKPSRQVTTSINESYQQIYVTLIKEEAHSSALKAQEAIFRKQLGDAAKEVKRVTEIEKKMAMLQRELEIQDSGYRKYSQSLEQARIDNALQFDKISNISLIQPPSYELQPIRPSKLLNIALGLVIGIFGGIGLAYLAEFMEHTFNRPEDVEGRLRVPTIAALPYVSENHWPEDGTTVRSGEFHPAADFLMRTGYECEVQTNFTTLNNILVKRLRQSYESLPEDAAVIAVTSCHPGDGVTTVATYIAGLLAADGRNSRILIVDANLKHPQDKACRWPTSALEPERSGVHVGAINGDSIDNVELLQLEEHVLEHARKGHLSALMRLLPAIRNEYSHIIFDLPALWTDASPIHIATAMDAVILVIEAGHTRWEVAQRAMDRLTEASVHVLGAVLNKRRYYIPEWLYRRL